MKDSSRSHIFALLGRALKCSDFSDAGAAKTGTGQSFNMNFPIAVFSKGFGKQSARPKFGLYLLKYAI
ncbi:hypothetical protein [Ruegeria sediminis]|uniref:hypothetical protein n=1 Tax=Ruegeria sediminis TaxID=2583820 RepID=UPI001C558E4B|nr:hypothetical protein [Ruegeria sediminis]